MATSRETKQVPGGRVVTENGKKQFIATGEQRVTTKTGRGATTTGGAPEDPNIFRKTKRTRQNGQVLTVDPQQFKDIPSGQLSEHLGIPGFIPTPQSQQELLQFAQSQQFMGDPFLLQSISETIQQQETQRLFAEQEAREAGEPTRERGVTEKVAGIGTFIPVQFANLISKGLSIVGVDIGTLSNEQFASTDIGKLLGLGTLAIPAAAAAGIFAASLIPAATIGSLTPAAAAKAAIAAPAVKTGIAAQLGSSSLIKALFVGGAAVSLINGRIADLETSIVNQRETITLIGSGVQVGAISPQEAILMYSDIEEDLNSTESAIHQTALVSIKSWLGKGKEVETRVQKARQQLVTERGRLVQFVGQPQQQLQ